MSNKSSSSVTRRAVSARKSTEKAGAMTINEVAIAFASPPWEVQELIDLGLLQQRKDGLISDRAFKECWKRVFVWARTSVRELSDLPPEEKIKSALNQEIKLCRANRGISGKGRTFEDGFIAGLKESTLLVAKQLRAQPTTKRRERHSTKG